MKKTLRLVKYNDNWYLRLNFRYNRKKVFWYVGFLVLLLLCSVTVVSVKYFKNKVNQKQYTVGSIKNWMQSFTAKEFETCDSMVTNAKDRIVTNIEGGSLGTNTMSVDMYKAIIGACADSINEVKVVNDGNGRYTVTTSFTPVVKIDKVTLDEKRLQELVDEYLSGETTSKGFEKSLNELYFDSFIKTVLSQGTEESKTFSFELVEKNSEKVEGVYDYIYKLLQETNLYDNLKVYEESAQSTFNTILTKKG